jgi:hypothetical protein
MTTNPNSKRRPTLHRRVVYIENGEVSMRAKRLGTSPLFVLQFSDDFLRQLKEQLAGRMIRFID